MHDHLENSPFALVQLSLEVDYMINGTHPLLDHHQEELWPLARSGLTLRLEVVENK